MTTRAKGLRWHRRAIDDFGIDFRDESFPRLESDETLVATPAGPELEIVQLGTDGTRTDVLAQFQITDVAINGDRVTWRKGAATTGEQDGGTNYELLVLVYTSKGRRISSTHPLEVVETGDPDPP